MFKIKLDYSLMLVNYIEDKVQLQKYLDSLQDWAENWGMRFNAQKCYILSTATARKQIPYFYQLNGEMLQYVQNNPYLGVTLSTDLKFNKCCQIIPMTSFCPSQAKILPG